MLAQLAALPPDQRAQVSPDWLARVNAASDDDIWMFGYTVRDADTGTAIGTCGFKTPPSAEQTIEIAYGTTPAFEGRGIATWAAGALAAVAFASGHVRTVIAHTIDATNASTRVLEKNGFRLIGPVIDPEDGRVWRWERQRS